MRDNDDYIRVLLYSYYTTITGWGVPPKEYHAKALLFAFQREGSSFLNQHSAVRNMGPEYAPLGHLEGFEGPLRVHRGYIVGIEDTGLGAHGFNPRNAGPRFSNGNLVVEEP